MPVDLTSENLNQVKDLYVRAMELLDVEKRLKKYVPEFSTPSELSVYNLLEIENVQGLKLKGIKNAN